jgi:hypothetical protein
VVLRHRLLSDLLSFFLENDVSNSPALAASFHKILMIATSHFVWRDHLLLPDHRHYRHIRPWLRNPHFYREDMLQVLFLLLVKLRERADPQSQVYAACT